VQGFSLRKSRVNIKSIDTKSRQMRSKKVRRAKIKTGRVCIVLYGSDLCCEKRQSFRFVNHENGLGLSSQF
jgi:hypothetical protein